MKLAKPALLSLVVLALAGCSAPAASTPTRSAAARAAIVDGLPFSLG